MTALHHPRVTLELLGEETSETEEAAWGGAGEPEEPSDTLPGDGMLFKVYFTFDSPRLEPATLQTLEERLPQLRSSADQIELHGHCDVRGDDEYNLALSLRRAQAVQRYLQQSGISEGRITAQPYGRELPDSFLETEEGHRLNRRVEVYLRRAGAASDAPGDPSAE